MNQSTDIEVLTYLKQNSSILSKPLPSSKKFTNSIRTHKKHLDSAFEFFLSEGDYALRKSFWERAVRSFLENIYLPNDERYVSLVNMYCRLTNKSICRPIQGEKSDFLEEKQDECHVCCMDIKDNLSCGHWVCKSCIINSGKETCPLCRKVVSLNLEEVKQMIIIKEKRKQEKYEDERRQLLSENQVVAQEQLITTISFSLEMYRRENLRVASLNSLRAWCRLYEMHNFPRDNPVYQQAMRIIG
jgi:hypothetical protein